MNSPPTEVVTVQELDAKVNKRKINIEVKDICTTKVEKYHRQNNQNNLVPALLEQKFQSISEEHHIITLINKWDDLDLLPTQPDLIGCILPKKESIRAGPDGRRFLERLTEHMKSTHPYIDPDFIK